MDEVASASARAWAVSVLTLSAAVVVLHEAATILAPIFVAVLLAYALDPVVVALTRVRVPRPVAAVLVYAMLALAVGSVSVAAAYQVEAFVDDFPTSFAAVKQRWESEPNERPAGGPVDRLKRAATELNAVLNPRAAAAPGVARVMPVEPGFNLGEMFVSARRGVARFTLRAFIIAVLTFLLLATGDSYKRKLLKLAGPRWEERKLTLDVIRTIDRQIQRYLLARLLISGIVAVATAFALLMLGVSHALVWGAIAGVLNVLPIVGPTIACASIALAALLQFQTIEMTMAAGGVAVAIAALEGNLITPLLTGRAGELNTVAVFVSVLMWGWIWSMWGLLLAVPIMVAVKAAADHLEPLQPLGELLGR